MRVAMLGWEFPPFVSGGLGVHCMHLAIGLCRLGARLDFYMPSFGEGIQPLHPSMRIIPLPQVSITPYFRKPKSAMRAYGENVLAEILAYKAAAVKEVAKRHVQEKYDILHAHDWLTALPGLELSRKLGIPLVQTIHSTEYDRNPFPWGEAVKIEQAAVAGAERVITVSRRMSDSLRSRFSADPSKVRVIYNAVEKREFQHQKPENHNLIFSGKKKVLFLGRLTEQKGPSHFLHAAKKVLAHEPQTVFLVAGAGPLLPELISLSMSLGISKNIFFLGYLPDHERRKIYSECDAYVMPSVSEPFGITALESMASGTPAVVSKDSGVGEVARAVLRSDFWDSQRMAEHLIGILRYPVLARTMSGMCAAEAEKFSWEKVAEETMNVYKELTKKGGS